MKFANLHLHSIYSDGAQTPDELFTKAKEMGYGALAITDHNTVTGWDDFKDKALYFRYGSQRYFKRR